MNSRNGYGWNAFTILVYVPQSMERKDVLSFFLRVNHAMIYIF